MKYVILVLIWIVGTTKLANSQTIRNKTLVVNMGPEILFPTANSRNLYHVGIGGTIETEWSISKYAGISFGSGVYHLPARMKANTPRKDFTGIPLKMGMIYHLGNFYGAAEGGLMFQISNIKQTAFLFSFTVGDKIHLGDHILDAGIRFEQINIAVNPVSLISLRLAYEFTLLNFNKAPQNKLEWQ